MNNTEASKPDMDLGLMRRVAADDEQAMAELYDRFGSLVYKMAYQAMPTRAEAEDAVQEVFVKLWRTAAKFDPKRASLVTWVMLITRRHLVDRMRRASARLKPGVLEEGWSPPAKTEAPAAGLQRDERLAGLMTTIETLPELQQTVVTRAYLRGHTLKQICTELGVPLGTVKSALSRALVRLRERVNFDDVSQAP